MEEIPGHLSSVGVPGVAQKQGGVRLCLGGGLQFNGGGCSPSSRKMR